MNQEVPELEQRLSELQAQVDRLSFSLHARRQNEDHVPPVERRLAQLTDRCEEILESWKTLGERHAFAVNELENRISALDATESRLEQNASHRYQNLGRMIEREWQTLRQLHEEPIKLLREQAASLTEVCIATANSAQNGFDRAEARFATLESEMHRRMAELSRDVHTAVASLRPAGDHPQWALPPAAGSQTWPLEGVMRLHNQLREGDGPSKSPWEEAPPIPEPVRQLQGPSQLEAPPPKDATAESEESAALVNRINSLERAVTDGKVELNEIAQEAERTRQVSLKWRTAVAALAICLLGAGGLAWQLQRRAVVAAAQSADAERQRVLAAEAANQRIAESREEASREIAQARETALKAQTVSDVLAAPDLVRYSLTGGDPAQRSSGQFLWSRSRGLVFSASRLPAPAAGTIYQVWLVTSAEPVSAGVFMPDQTGRATIASDDPPRVPRPVIGIKVTVEPSGGSEMPTGAVMLTRAPIAES